MHNTEDSDDTNRDQLNSQGAQFRHIAKFGRYWTSKHVSMKVSKL